MFNFLKSDLEIIRGEAIHFLTKNLSLTKSTAKQVSLSIDDDAAKFLISITPNPDMVMKAIRKIIAAKLAYLLNPNQENELINAIAVDIEHVLSVEIPMATAQGQLSSEAMSNSAVLSGFVRSYVTDRVGK